MPDIIHLLPDSVANQIAAGEVVQRPASVVKELTENSIDAGSTDIQVIIRDGGKTLIQIIDNGSGMSETDARLCLERHATSKIREANDLFAIKTMGFRGEALASIAAVAEVELKTCTPNNQIGTIIRISGSEVIEHEPTSCPEGTSICVKNLFFNIPARRKFLKSTSLELKHIISEFQRVALANPQIAFSLHHNGANIYKLPAGNIKQRITHLMGKNLGNNLIDLKTETSVISISGFIGRPESAKKSPGEQFFFVNNRFMRSPYL
ncbi:MAG: DNA mismatch repair endonuclease MutL, partial [Bacteroidales bacterium]